MTRLVLAGAGAAQFILLEAMARGRVRADEVVMIGPATQLHGPMIPGWLAGRFTEDEITVDVRQLAQRAGCRFVEVRVASMDAAGRTLLLEDGSRHQYDILSLTPDEQPAGLDIPGASRTIDVCPSRRARRILPSIAEARAAAGSRTVAVAVAGAGLMGFEMAIALHDRMQRDGSGVTVMLVDPANPLLPEQDPEVGRMRTHVAQSALGVIQRRRVMIAWPQAVLQDGGGDADGVQPPRDLRALVIDGVYAVPAAGANDHRRAAGFVFRRGIDPQPGFVAVFVAELAGRAVGPEKDGVLGSGGDRETASDDGKQ